MEIRDGFTKTRRWVADLCGPRLLHREVLRSCFSLLLGPAAVWGATGFLRQEDRSLAWPQYPTCCHHTVLCILCIWKFHNTFYVIKSKKIMEDIINSWSKFFSPPCTRILYHCNFEVLSTKDYVSALWLWGPTMGLALASGMLTCDASYFISRNVL